MPKYRDHLPQLDGGIFLTDGGLETTLIFREGMNLPEFAAFMLLYSQEGRERLFKYFSSYAAIARDSGAGFVLDTPTWRASADWGEKLGISVLELDMANREAIKLLSRVREEYEGPDTPVVISGCIGPRGDGYSADSAMTAEEAESYHARQVDVFAATEADMVSALTMTNAAEAAGIVRAGERASLPVVISFTVETDGRLPSGQALGEAIEEVDGETDGRPVYYMINCAHPTHFAGALEAGSAWVKRIRGIRANASTMSHAELDNSTRLDDGDPVDLGSRYKGLVERIGNLNVLGGCCGTDERHVREIAKACLGR